MRLRRRRPARPGPLGAGEPVLAWCRSVDDVLIAGTRDALYLGEVRIAWEDVEAADWDRDTGLLRVSEVGSWGRLRPEYRLVIAEPGRLPELVRERVTASVVLQRHVPMQGRRGVRVVARRAPGGHQPIRWVFEYDEGIDPDDPDVAAAARAALSAAREEVGSS